MQFLKRITPLFLSFTLIACCLTFQVDTFVPSKTSNTSWVLSSIEQNLGLNAYQINLRKAHSIFENNFSIFNFKCCLKHHNSLYAMQYIKQTNLHLPKHTKHLTVIPKLSGSKDDSFIG